MLLKDPYHALHRRHFLSLLALPFWLHSQVSTYLGFPMNGPWLFSLFFYLDRVYYFNEQMENVRYRNICVTV